MNAEELEFAITQYLDGTLSAAEIAALEAILAEDAVARRLLEEYRSLNQSLKDVAGLPPMAWDKLAAHLSSAVAEEAEQLEYAASRYVDGTLDGDELVSFEAELEDGSLAQRHVEEHRAVTRLVRTPAGPAVQWQRLASHLSGAVADADERPTLKLFARPWVRTVVGMAMAACVMLVTGIGIRSYLHRGTGTTVGPIAQVDVGPGSAVSGVQPKQSIIVDISGPEKSSGTAVAEISIGAGPDAGNDAPAYAEGILGRSPRSLIATNGPAVQDSQLALDTYGMPY